MCNISDKYWVGSCGSILLYKNSDIFFSLDTFLGCFRQIKMPVIIMARKKIKKKKRYANNNYMEFLIRQTVCSQARFSDLGF